MKSSNTYKARFKKYGVNPKSLLWKSRGAAHQRFRQFWAEIDFDGKNVLDIGCGFGEFGKFLLKRYEGVSYKGIDVVPEFIEEARKLVPEGEFEVQDFNKMDGKYDVVIASGVLNSNQGGNEQNRRFRENAIKKMFSLTKDIFAFNMLGGHPTPKNTKDSNIWYTDSLTILRYCTSLTRRVILRANYHPRDFTIVMHKTSKLFTT